MKLLYALILTSIFCATAEAQFPSQPGYTPLPGQYQPNIYGRKNQPLSPYLNLLRGQGNPGIDYYYGVRPGLQSGGQPLTNQFGSGGQGGGLNNSQIRTGYLPQAGIPTSEPIPIPEAGKEVILAPSAHAVSYGNSSGISRAGIPGATVNRPGFFAPPTTGTVKKK